ncbi:MAG: radical SAM protein [Phycisphaerae bacterium]|nr:radical SAM protein [Phycisphaerae bacterium]NUQ44639.1 radical SAM protein [Phycisphaerae bacterium]
MATVVADNPFVVRSFAPAHADPGVRRSLPDRVAAALEELRCCRDCPRNCRIDRLANQSKVCNTGRRGSGTIFFSMCNLRCVFCQNWEISQRRGGRELDAAGVADLMLSLQATGCHNINFVTPEHVVPQIVEALAVAIDGGLRLPIVYNTSAYDALGSLRLMEGLVDIYMPDFKFWSSESARRLAKAKDYPDRAREAIREMHRQVGVLRFTPDGLACRGVLVRHLVMPGQIDESRAIFRWLADELSPDTYVNIMAQYRPDHEVGRIAEIGGDAGRPKYADINRPPHRAELEAAYAAAREAGLWRIDERRAGL